MPDAPPESWPTPTGGPPPALGPPARRSSPLLPLFLCVSVGAAAMIWAMLAPAPGDDRAAAPTVSSEVPSREAREVADAAPELVAYVEGIREHSFVASPGVETLSDDDFAAAVDQWIARDEAVLDERTTLYRTLGIVEPGFHLAGASRADLMAASALYDPVSGRLVVRGSQTTLAVEVDLVSALALALEDAHFDLVREDRPPTEASRALLLVGRAAADLVLQRYIDELPPEDRARAGDLRRARLSAGGDVAPAGVRAIREAESQVRGLVLTAAADGGMQGIDRLLERPPVTIQQALDPVAYEQGSLPIAVSEPLSSGATIASARFTPLELVGMGLGEVAGRWAGGQYVTWTGDGGSCTRFRVIGSTDPDTEVLADSIGGWSAANAAFSWVVFDEAAGRDVVEAVRCG